MMETQNIEWKEKWHDKYLEWICGFANAEGGRLVIGRDDAGNVVGVRDVKKLLEDIPNKVRDAMGILVDVNVYEKNGLEYIEIVVPPYPVGISCKGIYYIRSGSTKQVLTGPALEAFLLRKRGITWDNMAFPAFTMDDVDDEAIACFKELSSKSGRIEPKLLDEPKAVLLEKLHLTHGSYLTNAAMLLFAKKPEQWMAGAYVKIGYFETDADLLYQDEVHGPLITIVDRIMELVYLKYMRAKITYEGIQRIERYFVPKEALREALLNAIVHKQYQSCIPIQVSVYEDRVYIANVGCLPEHWTMDDLLGKHASRPYNPKLANVFHIAGFIESWGRGVEKIQLACAQNEAPAPKYFVKPQDIMIEFTASEEQVVRKPINRMELPKSLSKTQQAILDLLIEDPGYTREVLREKLNMTDRTIARHVKQLREKGIIRRVGSKKNGYWEIHMDKI
nr:ATP-binding protein [uncultured Dubosiella sp.]